MPNINQLDLYRPSVAQSLMQFIYFPLVKRSESTTEDQLRFQGYHWLTYLLDKYGIFLSLATRMTAQLAQTEKIPAILPTI